MSDFPASPDLDAIRSRVLSDMSKSHSSSDLMDGHADTEQAERQQAEMKRQQEEMRAGIMARVLTHEARERLMRIHMVRPDRGRALEDLLINAAHTGQLRGSSPNGQLTEQDLVGLLEKIGMQEQAVKEASKVKFHRRGFGDSLFDDDDDF